MEKTDWNKTHKNKVVYMKDVMCRLQPRTGDIFTDRARANQYIHLAQSAAMHNKVLKNRQED